MKRSTLSVLTASVFLAGVGLASAQTTTSSTTTWSSDQGNVFRQYSTTQHYDAFSDPALHPSIGAELPPSVPLHPLPSTMNIPSSESYSYSIINNQPVVVERTTRKVVHTWDMN